MKIFRIEHRECLNGMWTRKINGKIVLDYLSDDRLSKLPMPKDDIFRTDNKVWKTGVQSIDSLLSWFSEEDIREMIGHGFCVKELDVNLCDIMVQENQVLFDDSKRIEENDITDDFIFSESTDFMKDLREKADDWFMNGGNWSANDGTGGDNYGSFIAGAKWAKKYIDKN